MTQPDTLHTRLRAEIERRLAVAKAAASAWANIGAVVEAGPDGVPFAASDYVVAHIALHDPADAIRRYEGELEVLDRHTPNEDHECRQCLWPTGAMYENAPIAYREDWPCIELIGLAQRLGVNIHG